MNQHRIKLANLIRENINSLAISWSYKARTTCGIFYQNKSLEELKESAHNCLESYLEVLLNNNWSPINSYVSNLIGKRFKEGLSFDEIIQAFLVGKLIISSLVKKTATEDIDYLTTEINDLTEQVLLLMAKHFYLCSEEILSAKLKSLTTLYETSLACASKNKIEDIIDVTYHKLKEFLPLDSFYFALCDDDCSKLNFVSIIDQGTTLPKFSTDIGESSNTLTVWVIKNRKPLLIKNMEKEVLPAGHVEIGKLPNPLSILTVPLILKERVLGVISLQSFKTNAYNEADLELLQAIAINIALAMENANLYEKTYEASITDHLTGLKNRLYFSRALEAEIARANRYQSKFTILFGDIDNFKYYNDLLGYAKGDEILKHTAKVLTDNIRESDILARFGGDEFIILLPKNNKEDALYLTNRFNLILSSYDPPISISWGVLCYPDDASDKDDLISLADTQLKIQKRR